MPLRPEMQAITRTGPPLLLIGFLLLSGYSAAARQEVKVSETARIFQEFVNRVQKYAELQKQAKRELPSIGADATPEMISNYQNTLAAAIRAARANAREGDIFFPEARSEFRRIIARELGGPAGAAARALITEDNPRKIFLRVNATYPEDLPLPAVPPSLLINLPRLPPEVEYRFVNRDLILLDSSANLIVDFMRDVVPRS
jgi:hypothetical protein